jgi:hypothetical protein
VKICEHETWRLRTENVRLRTIIEAADIHHGKLKHALRDAVAMIPKARLDEEDKARLSEIVELIR